MVDRRAIPYRAEGPRSRPRRAGRRRPGRGGAAGWAEQIGPARAPVLRKTAAVLTENRAEFERWLVREGGAVPGKAAIEVDLALGELWEAAALPTQPWCHL